MHKGKDGVYRDIGQHPEDVPELQHFREFADDDVTSNESVEQALQEAEDYLEYLKTSSAVSCTKP